MKKISSVFFGVFIFFLAGCASTIQFVPMPDQSKILEDSSKARIYIVRPASLGGLVPMDVKDNDKFIGQTGPKGYLCWEREPGNIEISSKAENLSLLPIRVKGGMVYYIQQSIKMGILYARNKLERLSDYKGRESIDKCKPAKVQIEK